MQIETIFFDLGGVLVDFSHEKMCQNLANYCNIEITDIKKLLFEEDIGEKYERGLINSQMLFEILRQKTSSPIAYDEVLIQAAQIFTPKPEMEQLLEKLKTKGLHLILLSNTCEAHFWHAQKHFKFLDLFDGYVLSYEVKARKPEKAIFEKALKLGKTPKENCFYIDDVLENVEAAINCGIDSHLFKGKENLTRALEKRGCRGL